jgi:hypothetical protein
VSSRSSAAKKFISVIEALKLRDPLLNLNALGLYLLKTLPFNLLPLGTNHHNYYDNNH